MKLTSTKEEMTPELMEEIEASGGAVLPFYNGTPDGEYYIADERLVQLTFTMFNQLQCYDQIVVAYAKEFDLPEGTQLDAELAKSVASWVMFKLNGEVADEQIA